MSAAPQTQSLTDAPSVTVEPPRIVIVGGGAGGLELATHLGDKLGKRGKATITLIDRARTHVWKPKLHEIAAGSMDMGLHEVPYRAQARWHHFRFRVGELIGLDRVNRQVHIGPYVDEDGVQMTPARRFDYDVLVISVGSLNNSFGVPGVEENTVRLETPGDARAFQRRMVNACIRAHAQEGPLEPHQLQVAIVGAGATGVELAAELHRTRRELVSYGLDKIDPNKDLSLHVIEASERILPGLPERLSKAAEEVLKERGVEVHTNAAVAEVLPREVVLKDGRTIPAELVVWAAGIKAPECLNSLDGLEANSINQLVVSETLQTTLDDRIFAMGDCAQCPWPEAPEGMRAIVPPRAQAAHQQASHLYTQIRRYLAGQELKPYRYRDFGSLVSLGSYSTVGSLMGGLVGGAMVIEGLFARLMYESLYKMHELALHGFSKVTLDTLARILVRRTEPHVKLH